jgi:hypothetical protein
VPENTYILGGMGPDRCGIVALLGGMAAAWLGSLEEVKPP